VRLFAFCLFTFAFLLGTACRPAAEPVSVSNRVVSINDRPTSNLPMPPSKPIGEMSWTDANDRVQKVSDLKGKAVILDFWATNCPPCRAEIPHLNSLIAKYGAQNIIVVGMHVGDDEDRANIPEFIKDTKIDYPIAFPETELSRFIFSERDDIPQTLVIDRNGKIVTKIIGFSPAIQTQLDAAIKSQPSA
jgi:thiol-disulfide isomerase/thioredoxin